MPDMVLPGPVEEASCPANSVNIHTNKIYSACRDKDCVEDLRVYPTVSSQALISSALSVRPSSATLLSADVNVDAISFNRGYYTVDVTYFYRVTGTVFPGGCEVSGLAVFDKRVILFGSEGSVKVFSSDSNCASVCTQYDDPVAYVSAVDPIALSMKLLDCSHTSCPDDTVPHIPSCIIEAIGEELVMNDCGRRLYVTLGQFSVIRLERPALLTLRDVERFFPDAQCAGSSSSEDDPCALFSRVDFPVEEFLPPDRLRERNDYKDLV